MSEKINQENDPFKKKRGELLGLAEAMKRQNCYEKIGVARTASWTDVKTAKRQASLKYHPDGKPEELKDAYKTVFQMLADVIEAFHDEKTRKEYDSKLNNQSRPNFGTQTNKTRNNYDPQEELKRWQNEEKARVEFENSMQNLRNEISIYFNKNDPAKIFAIKKTIFELLKRAQGGYSINFPAFFAITELQVMAQKLSLWRYRALSPFGTHIVFSDKSKIFVGAILNGTEQSRYVILDYDQRAQKILIEKTRGTGEPESLLWYTKDTLETMLGVKKQNQQKKEGSSFEKTSDDLDRFFQSLKNFENNIKTNTPADKNKKGKSGPNNQKKR